MIEGQSQIPEDIARLPKSKDTSYLRRLLLLVLVTIAIPSETAIDLGPVHQVTKEEEPVVEQWKRDADLNPYGDDKYTAYKGGTPLFNEKTGEVTPLNYYTAREQRE